MPRSLHVLRGGCAGIVCGGGTSPTVAAPCPDCPPSHAVPGPVSTPCGFSRVFYHFPRAVSCFSSSCLPVGSVALPARRTFAWQTLMMWVCRTGSVLPGPLPRSPTPRGPSCPLQTGLATGSRGCDYRGRASRRHSLAQ